MDESKDLVMQAIDYIEDHLDENISLDDISNVINYSKYHMNRIFSQKVGCTIHKYIQMRRLTKAAEELIETDKQIVDIAYEAGYHSQQAFTLAFKQIHHYPPQIYREIGIFRPKQNKFTMTCRWTPCRSFFEKKESEVLAA